MTFKVALERTRLPAASNTGTVLTISNKFRPFYTTLPFIENIEKNCRWHYGMANCAKLPLKLFNTAATTGDILRNYWFRSQIYQLLLLLSHNSYIDQCCSKRIRNQNEQKYLLCPMFIHSYLKYINSDVAEKYVVTSFWIEKILNKHRKWLIYLHQVVKRFYFNYSKNKISNGQIFASLLIFWEKNRSVHVWTKYQFFLCKENFKSCQILSNYTAVFRLMIH